jgi:hypothetical protein
MIKIDEPINISAKPEPPPIPGPAAIPQIPAVGPMTPTPLGPAPVPGPRQVITKQELQSPGEVAARQDRANAVAGLRETAGQQGEVNAAKATNEATQADEYQKLLAQQQEAAAKEKAAWDARKAKDAQIVAQAREDGLKDPNAGESFGHKLLSALAIGLGQYSAAMTHTDNAAARIFEDARKEALGRQQAKITAAEKAGELTHEQAREAMSDLQAKDLGQIQAFNARWKAESAKLGIPQARIDANKNTQTLDKAEAEATAKLDQADRITVRDLTPKELKEGKPKGTGGGGGAISELAQMKQDGADPAAIQRRAEQLHIKPKDYLPVIKDVEAGNKPGGGGIGSVRQNAVLGNLAEAEKAAKDITPGGVSMDSIQKLQTNEETSKAAHHSAEGGVFGNLAARAARMTGAAARGRYDGIPEDQQKKITAAEQVITHLTEMQQGKNIETLEQYRDRYSPYVPGLSEAEVRRREKALPGLVKEQRAIQDPAGVGLKRQKAAEGPDPRIEQAKAVLADPKASARLSPAERAYLLKVTRPQKKTAAPADNGGNPLDDITL